jgi:hypothetical protein
MIANGNIGSLLSRSCRANLAAAAAISAAAAKDWLNFLL